MYYIYKIENLINQKKYIGLTNNLSRRRARHFTDLKRNCHDNSFLQKEFNIYGLENFSFELIEDNISEKDISKKEIEYIKLFDSYKNGYNQNEGGNFGPSNGGSHLTQSDIFNILAALEFMSRPGQVLANMYGVSRTTISRIKRGENHNQYKEEYYNLPLAERELIYQIFCDSTNFYEMKIKQTVLNSKRQLNKEQVFLFLFNEEQGRLIPLKTLMENFNIKSQNTFLEIKKGNSYKDYFYEYNNLNKSEKEKLASLLRQLATENPLNCGEAQTR